MSSKIVANKMIFYENPLSYITEGQFYNWRWLSINKPEYLPNQLNINDITHLMDICNETRYNQYENTIKNIMTDINNMTDTPDMIETKNMNEINYANTINDIEHLMEIDISQIDTMEMDMHIKEMSVFGKITYHRMNIVVMVDSSFSSKINLPIYMHSLVHTIIKANPYIEFNWILLNSDITKVETMHKLNNPTKYPNIDMVQLMTNYEYIEGNYMHINDSIKWYYLKYDEYKEHLILSYNEEILRTYNGYCNRNEVNDDTQLELLNYVCNEFNAMGLMLTDDKDLYYKTLMAKHVPINIKCPLTSQLFSINNIIEWISMANTNTN
jgi:hypothetical protein